MSNQISTQTFPFYGSQLVTFKLEETIYTAIKPIVEAIGLDWGGQQQKFSKSGDKFNCRGISIVAQDGKIREMLCMPIKKLNGWLFSINPDKVRSDLREKVIQYQEECFQALHDYWTTGKAERAVKTERLSKEHQQTIKELVLGRAKNLPKEAQAKVIIKQWSALKNHFGKTYKEIDDDQFVEAVSLLARLPLEGELIDTLALENKSAVVGKFSEEELRDQAWLWKISCIMLEMIRTVEKPLSQLGSSYAGACCGMLSEYGRYIERVRAPLARETEHIQLTNFSTWEWNQVLPELRRGEVGQLWGSDKAVTRQFA
ncbi:phage antirepressor N-terminal domain-containing protein [Testudinibacter sp. TR-2022]|uniref:phage antirepressor N-terminal domain-containing protein n=1 Tax=Testudinibacter sp. TR-2022 TaxID=2585029 RepID=UPI0011188781|nr:phage antirepressor N-terminal domain-containing protein [Testudinibacter sp. TR-2022]TNH06624.1 phage antirepressor Ant [Pasteurellaceae bacterium Phil11]TNH25683.1 phage antirepressor Ant [Testudinibacter sp. TR-2022]